MFKADLLLRNKTLNLKLIENVTRSVICGIVTEDGAQSLMEVQCAVQLI